MRLHGWQKPFSKIFWWLLLISLGHQNTLINGWFFSSNYAHTHTLCISFIHKNFIDGQLYTQLLLTPVVIIPKHLWMASPALSWNVKECNGQCCKNSLSFIRMVDSRTLLHVWTLDSALTDKTWNLASVLVP